jgi:hypothetical protein
VLGDTTAVVNDGARQMSSGLDDLWPVEPHPYRRWRGTDARILQAGAVVALLLIVTAIVGILAIAPARALGRQAAVDADRMTAAASDMYLKLANADAAANAYFTLPAESLDRTMYLGRYQQATAAVDRSLAAAVAYTDGDTRRLADLQAVANRLQNYRNVIDEATQLNAATQGGTVVATAYARVASDYLRDELLSAVGRLWTDETARLVQARSRGQVWLVASVLLPIGDLVVLVALQRWLHRRTRRRLNIGLLAGTVATAVVLGLTVWSWSHWPSANGQLAKVEQAVQRESGTQQLIERLLAARAQEYLEVGLNPDPAKHEQEFQDAARCGTADAIDAQVCTTHKALVDALNSGDQDKRAHATADVLFGGAGTDEFVSVELRLTNLIDGQVDATQQASDAMPSAPPTVGWWLAALALAAAAAAIAGLRPRLGEYR